LVLALVSGGYGLVLNVVLFVLLTATRRTVANASKER
jgi:hypothetical protein